MIRTHDPIHEGTDRHDPAIRLAEATAEDRETIYRLRHEIFARELRQHRENEAGRLTDDLDTFNHYLCAWVRGEPAGFISITPPGGGKYSIDKYLRREELPFEADDRLYEVRLLSVIGPARGRELAGLLMYAAYRWVEARGGTRIVAIGRLEVLRLYERAGLRPTGMWFQSGAVVYELMQATIGELRTRLARFKPLLARLESITRWDLDFAFHAPAPCFHGGAFFDAIGVRCDALDRRARIINADVLDAWYPPSPRVLAALAGQLEWILRTSPPAHAEGLAEVIAETRGVTPANILPGAGSSDLIFRAFPRWFNERTRALILDPTYGEYPHVLEKILGCRVARLELDRRDNYRLKASQLLEALARGYDLVVLVNPNSPTGGHMPREILEPILRAAPGHTCFWIDETYVEYAGPGQSLERFAAASDNVVVCKSMSKVYALSGARTAYLCAAPRRLESMRSLSPPWAVSLPAQVAAIHALQDPGYYAGRYLETHRLRVELQEQLSRLGWDVVPGCANFLLAHLPDSGPGARELIRVCRERSLFLRDVGNMSPRFGDRALRIAVKDADTNQRMISILRDVLKRDAPALREVARFESALERFC